MQYRDKKLFAACLAMYSCVTSSQAQQIADTSETTVTATRIERELFETPQAVTVIDDRAVEEANVSATPDLFRYAEGVYLQKTNLGGGSAFIRGLTGKQVLILIDGVRLNNSYYRFGPHQYLNTIDPNIIERIEVVRGSGSALYGSDALGGVINVITKRRTDFSKDLDLDALAAVTIDTATAGERASDQKTGGAALRFQSEGNRGELGWLGGISGKRYDDLHGGGDVGDQEPSGYDEFSADLKFNYAFGANAELIFAQQYLRQYDVPKTSEVTLDGKAKFNYEPQQHSLSYLEYRSKNLALFDQTKITLSYNRQIEGEEVIKIQPIETREITDVATVGLGAQFTNQVHTAHRLTYGLSYYRDNFNTKKNQFDHATNAQTSLAPGTPDGAEYISLGAYVQDEVSLEQSEIIVGLRYSRFDTEGRLDHPTEGLQTLKLDTDKLTASLNGLYHLTPSVNLVGGVAQGFRAPNMEDFFGRVDFSSEIPNTRLEPEESLNWDIGLKYYRRHTTANIYYYLGDYDKLITRVEVSPGVEQRRNIDKARIQGLEGSLNHEFDRHWMLALNAAWTRGENKVSNEPLRRIPPLNGTFRLRYTARPALWYEAATLLAAKQDRLSPGDVRDKRIPEGGTPGYAIFNLKLGYQAGKQQQLLVTLENLGDRKYKTHGSGLYAAGRSLAISYRSAWD